MFIVCCICISSVFLHAHAHNLSWCRSLKPSLFHSYLYFQALPSLVFAAMPKPAASSADSKVLADILKGTVSTIDDEKYKRGDHADIIAAYQSFSLQSLL